MADGRTVGEAILAIRRRALDTSVRADHLASYFSYLAYAPPGLGLEF